MPVVMVEGFIHVEMYERCCKAEQQSEQENCESEIITHTCCHHNHHSDSLASPINQVMKQPHLMSGPTVRQAGPSATGSLFQLPSHSNQHVIQKTTKVHFKKIFCAVDSSNGDVSFNALQNTISGFLQDIHFTKGSMKVAHEVSLFLFSSYTNSHICRS
ncbi:hypothetical protein P691DRAFT_769946 [Macrolepiota fuliginosa MF-IS2]|uniref:Uncharacterized protein n=1 Tax=Macrolepiota fuliginosa MF-IS2 TaxID=1400762 RepID=A0A9P5WX04_9AGAR|nr:hypothetical protein P691DRAFT_769946 [Macrolepiota fuliginosa MF-IS2]